MLLQTWPSNTGIVSAKYAKWHQHTVVTSKISFCAGNCNSFMLHTFTLLPLLVSGVDGKKWGPYPLSMHDYRTNQELGGLLPMSAFLAGVYGCAGRHRILNRNTET